MTHLRDALFVSEHGISRTCRGNDQKQTIQGNGHAAFTCAGESDAKDMFADAECFQILRLECQAETALGGGDILAVNLVAVYPHIAGEFCKSLIVIGRALDNEQQGVTAVFSPLIGGVFGSGNVAVLCTVRHKGIGFIIGAARCVGDRNDC